MGIDLSLTRTAVATLTPRGSRVNSHPTFGRKEATLTERWKRLDEIAGWVLGQVNLSENFVVIESPAHGQATGSHHDRSGLWWMIVNQLAVLRVPVVEVAPTSLKKYATGKGNAGKDEVILRSARRYGD
ncbi:MAG: hypothetical protein L0G99_13065, partial [Propionibacteriales bacterium]|nr:hypothetical protein [Propionibacteriales bacterium]